MPRETRDETLLCPSAQPDMDGAQVIGAFIANPDGGMRVGYLAESLPVSAELLAVAGPAQPAEVLRVAAPCMGGGCVHHGGGGCQLAARVTAMLSPVVGALPRCAIRPTCLWFRQEGRAACLRCPQVITDRRVGTELDRAVAGAAGAG